MNYQMHYDKLIERARNREKPEGYTERHHAVPKCLGGSNKKHNLVVLTAREHLVAHLLLAKSNPGNLSLLGAVKAMLKMQLPERIAALSRSKRYEWARREFSFAMSQHMKMLYKDGTRREAESKRLREFHAANPDVAVEHSEKLRKHYSDPSARTAHSKRMKQHYRDAPDYAEKMRQVHRSDAKLTQEIVDVIRARYIPRDATNGTRALAREYCVSQSYMSQVIGRKRWR